MSAQLVSSLDLQRAFNVSHMAIIGWRKGSATRAPLPVFDTGTRNVRFKVSEVKRWAAKHEVPIVNPEALSSHQVKLPGPQRKAA